jgi:hypothetical protein
MIGAFSDRPEVREVVRYILSPEFGAHDLQLEEGVIMANRRFDVDNYAPFWRDQAVDKILAAQPLTVPVMLVHSLWDQEDIYGAPAVYKAIEPKDTGNDKVFLVLGPWHHGQEIADGSALGAIRFGSDTAAWFRREVLRPFLDQYLKDGAPKADVAPVTAFETGTNRWLALPTWPARLSLPSPP